MQILTTLNGHVLVRPRKAASALTGIEIPDSVDKEAPTVGEVLINNPIKFDGSPVIGIGTHVLFHALSPKKVVHDGEECLLVNVEDIYAIVQE